ncbi:MAG: hypothetical protein GX594_09680, partial [Pirellulaceae bacterium]|nr:hypothetical protein [Pirellulaceae bacterium]
MINRKGKKILVGACALVACAVLVAAATTERGTCGSHDEERYLEAAKLGGLYLVNHLDDSGRYVYEYDPEFDVISKHYNILRHAGTTYSLLELYEVTRDDKYLIAAEKALDYLLEQTIPCPCFATAECVVEDDIIKLGGNGLAVLAMAKHAGATGSHKYLSHAQKLAEYITSAQEEDGEFKIHTMGLLEGTVPNYPCQYFPGEAIFALARLHQIDGNEKWINAAHKGAKWLIEVRDAGVSIDDLEHDHWLLYALNELHGDNADELYVKHSKKITDAILALQHKYYFGKIREWNGGYYAPPRSTPTATRSEGLAAAVQTFKRAGETKYAIKTQAAVRRGLDFQLKTQITPEKIAQLKC